MAARRSYLVLACNPASPEGEALWLEWPTAYGARWSSRYLRSRGYAVIVLPASLAGVRALARETALMYS
jgi:hypothetical protein